MNILQTELRMSLDSPGQLKRQPTNHHPHPHLPPPSSNLTDADGDLRSGSGCAVTPGRSREFSPAAFISLPGGHWCVCFSYLLYFLDLFTVFASVGATRASAFQAASSPGGWWDEFRTRSIQQAGRIPVNCRCRCRQSFF